MARRNDHSRDEIKSMAIAAGKALLAEEGLPGFSTRKVAKEIGYTVGTLYNIFTDHDDLLMHINATTLDDMHAFLREHTLSDAKGEPAIKALADAYGDFARAHYHLWNTLFAFSLPQGTSYPSWYTERIRRLFILVEKPLEPLCHHDAAKTEQAAKVIWAGIHGICQLGMTGKLDTVGASSIRALTDSLVEHYVRGLQHA